MGTGYGWKHNEGRPQLAGGSKKVDKRREENGI